MSDKPSLLVFFELTFHEPRTGLTHSRVTARGTEVEKRLLEALSGENWGASSSLMNQIANDTYD